MCCSYLFKARQNIQQCLYWSSRKAYNCKNNNFIIVIIICVTHYLFYFLLLFSSWRCVSVVVSSNYFFLETSLNVLLFWNRIKYDMSTVDKMWQNVTIAVKKHWRRHNAYDDDDDEVCRVRQMMTKCLSWVVYQLWLITFNNDSVVMGSVCHWHCSVVTKSVKWAPEENIFGGLTENTVIFMVILS